MNALRPHPHRGDVVAAGAVPLALAAIAIELRMRQWSLAPRFVVVALLAGLILTIGALAELEGPEPRPYHSVLLVSGLLPLIVALRLLAEVLGASRPPGAGGDFWTFGAEAALAFALARRFNSGICTLIAALAGAVAVEAFVAWVFAPHGPGTFRAFTVVLTLAFALGAVRLRDVRRRHAVQFVNAAGLVTLVLALTFVVQTAISLVVGFSRFPPLVALSGVGVGWKLWLLAVGFGLVAYAAVDREAGPAYIGASVLLTFALLVGLRPGPRGSLVFWPLFLLVIGAAGLAIGLRPRRALPPPPVSGTTAPTVPMPSRPSQGP